VVHTNIIVIIYSVNCHCDMQIQPFTSEGPRVHGGPNLYISYSEIKWYSQQQAM